MATVPQKTLSWLYKILGNDYHDPTRTYQDLAQTLAQYSSFAPRTDVYTFENGSSALLVHFVGTIPVSFRGATYRFPIALWIPYGYPYEAPLVYVTPTEQMVVRPGQHVSGEGRVYHHYLAHWGQAWDRSNLVDLLSLLSDVFAREPPVVSRQQQVGRPPPVPPPEIQRSSFQSTNRGPAQPTPPRPPPPPKESEFKDNGGQSSDIQNPSRYETAPPLPPKPDVGNSLRSASRSSSLGGAARASNAVPQYMPQRNSSLRQSYPVQQMQYQSESPEEHYQSQARDRQPAMSPAIPPAPPLHPTHYSPLQQQHPPYQAPALPLHDPPSSHDPQQRHVQYLQNTMQQPQAYPLPQQAPSRAYQQQQQTLQPAPPKPKAAPPVNLLDSHFDVSLPVASTPLPAPPIPRNPEKDALLSTLSATLTQTLHNSISQNSSALPSLHAQHTALTSSYQNLDSELSTLTDINTTLTSNISILQSALHNANGAIAAARERAKKGDVPNVDEMLTAPTVVGKQLYDVVCEERGIEAGIWALQEGFVRGRISVEVWGRKTRELAREGFKRRVLAEKIGRGIGLEVRV